MPIDPNFVIQLRVTVNELNIILKWMAKAPIDEGIDIYAKIRQQADAAIQLEMNPAVNKPNGSSVHGEEKKDGQ